MADRNLWTSLRTRIPSDVRSAPLSRVPWSEGKVADVSRACAEHGLRRVDDLLTHDLTLLGAHWANARTCDVLQDAFLSTLSYTARCLPDEATSFAGMLEALIAAMPSENEAQPLRVASGWARVPGATSRALRFHEPFLTRLRTKLEQLLVLPDTLAQLRERDPFFSDLPSVSELEHFARTALRLSLHLFMNAEGEGVIAKERPPKVSERALAPIARTKLGDARASQPAAVPVHVQDGLIVAEQVLTREGAPMSRGDLANRLGAAAQDTFYRMVARRPFVELDARSWGLIERDVPGGDRAFSAAIAMLRTRFPLTAPINDEVVEAVRLLSDAHRGWTRETIVTAIRCARASEIDV